MSNPRVQQALQLVYRILHFLLYSIESVFISLTKQKRGPPSDKYKPDRFLSGNYGPVEATDFIAENIAVTKGKLPEGLVGMYVRNGPNPKFVPTNKLYHWFDGDGMLQGVRFLPNGQVNYVRHQVKTKKFLLEEKLGQAIFVRIGELGGIFVFFKMLLYNLAKKLRIWGELGPEPDTSLDAGTANTAVVFYAKKILALHEGSYPFHVKIFLDGLMESIGYDKLEEKLKRAFTAHPKIDPVSKKLFFISPSIFDKNTRCTYSVLDHQGRIEHTVNLGIERAPFMHDFAITEHYAIFMDLPFLFTPEGMIKNELFKFYDSEPSRFGIMLKDAKSSADIRWFLSPACYAFHISNAWEEGDEVVLVACRFAKIYWTREFQEKVVYGQEDEVEPYPYQWRFNMKTGAVTERELVHIAGDFPTVNPDVVGRKTQYTYVAFQGTRSEEGFEGVMKMDPSSGQVLNQVYWPGNSKGGEANFVPRDPTNRDADEDNGYLISFVHDNDSNKSSVVVLNAKNLETECQIELPARVPHGFHGIFVSEEEIRSQL